MERKMWHANVEWQNEEIRAFNSAILYCSSDKDMPEIAFFFFSEPTTFHIRSTLGIWDRHLK